MPQGDGLVQPWKIKPSYTTYRSPYARSYKVPFNLAGIDRRLFLKYSMTGGALAGAAGVFALFFFSDIPRVRKDIMQKIPLIGDHFVKEVPPSDNPF